VQLVGREIKVLIVAQYFKRKNAISMGFREVVGELGLDVGSTKFVVAWEYESFGGEFVLRVVI